MSDISHTEAVLALETVRARRRDVVAEIGVPSWYWPGLAAGWIGLGVLADLGPAWASTAATLLFGAAHASVASRVLSGRHPSSQVSIRGDLVSRRMPAVIIAFLLGMTALTVALALLLDADGARHPALLASAVVAGFVLTGGPGVLARLRARAVGRAGA